MKSAFAASDRAYSSLRLRAALQQQCVALGWHRLRTLMRANGLQPVWRRKFCTPLTAGTLWPSRPMRWPVEFEQPKHDRAWVWDITYIRTRSGWLYLAAVLDLHSRKIVSWAMAPEMPATLACPALQMVIAQCNPAQGFLVHAGRETQGVFNQSSQHWPMARF